jgi:uncharacterized protein
MWSDDLNAPLGQDQVRERSSRSKAIALTAVLAGVGLLAAFASPLMQRIRPPAAGAPDSAHISQPAGPALQELVPNSDADRKPFRSGVKEESETQQPPYWSAGSTPAEYAATGPETIEKQAGVKIVRADGGGPPGAVVIDVAKALSAAVTTADSRLIEQSRYGPVPRIGVDGARPSKVYSRAAFSSPGEPHSPRIALVLGGMGLVARTTESAIATLPGEVTLGFAPYGSDLSRQTAQAREAGHEVVLQIPMEPFDYPRGNPGAHTLLARAGKAENIDNLTWLMSRFTGYAGVMNFRGGRFTADEKTLDPVLQEIAARGLFYLDDGSSSQTIAVTLAANQGLAAARADLVLDSAAEPKGMETALARLEAIARDKGVAIGVASALPSSIAAIGRFARALKSRGVSLIPLSAAMPNQQGGSADSSPVR